MGVKVFTAQNYENLLDFISFNIMLNLLNKLTNPQQKLRGKYLKIRQMCCVRVAQFLLDAAEDNMSDIRELAGHILKLFSPDPDQVQHIQSR